MAKGEKGNSDQQMSLHPMIPKPKVMPKNVKQDYRFEKTVGDECEAEPEVKNLCAVLYGQNDIRMVKDETSIITVI